MATKKEIIDTILPDQEWECSHDWQDTGKINDGYSRGRGIAAYSYTCSKCGETTEVEKDVT